MADHPTRPGARPNLNSDVFTSNNTGTLYTASGNQTENGETVIVTRKDEKNVVILSLEKYNQIMKAVRNAEYLAMIDRGLQQLESGKGQQHELIEVNNE